MAGLKLLLCVLLVYFPCLIHHGTCNDKMTLDKLGNKLDNLGEKISDFAVVVGKIDNMLTALTEKYTLNELIHKCAHAINTRNDIGANKIWKKIISHHNYTQAGKILDNIIISSYGGNRAHILPLIRFISQTKQCSGYETLYEEMDDYGHFYDGGELFSLASSLIKNCGGNTTLFQRMPDSVKLIFTTSVTLQNTFNKGFLFRKQNLQDNVMENHIATTKMNNTELADVWQFVASGEFAETFNIHHGSDILVASTSRRFYFSHENHSKFLLELNRRHEISIGLELDDIRGGKRIFYRLYVQNQRLRHGDIFEVNLWTINPKDEYYKYIHWYVSSKS